MESQPRAVQVLPDPGGNRQVPASVRATEPSLCTRLLGCRTLAAGAWFSHGVTWQLTEGNLLGVWMCLADAKVGVLILICVGGVRSLNAPPMLILSELRSEGFRVRHPDPACSPPFPQILEPRTPCPRSSVPVQLSGFAALLLVGVSPSSR